VAPAPTPAPDPGFEIVRVGQELHSFRDELMGREGSPGRLVRLEDQLDELRKEIPQLIKEAVTEAVRPMVREHKDLKSELGQQGNRISWLEKRWWLVTGGAVVLGYVLHDAPNVLKALGVGK
jgi:hypothetical protein